MKISTHDDVKQLAATIESLAHEIQIKIDSGSDVLSTANELIRNNLTLVFALGEVSAAQSYNTKKNPRNYSNYYKIRNNVGRFAKI